MVTYTITKSARRALGTKRVRPYLTDVITKLERGWSLANLHKLLPLEWAANQARQNASAEDAASATTSGAAQLSTQ
jgi:hypothetical protein